MRKKLLSVATLLVMVAALCTSCDCGGAKQGDKVVNFTTEITEDATYAVFDCLEDAANDGVSTITFEKGTYHFWPDKAYEQFCYISNHNDVLARIAFPIKDMKGLTIDGNGSTFIFHGRVIPFWVENSSDINIKNLTIDFAEAFHSEGLVVASNEKEKYFDLEISEEYPYEIKNDQLIYMKSYYDHTLGQAILYDPKTEAISFETELYTPITTGSKEKVVVGMDKLEYKYKTDRNDLYIKKRGIESPLKAVELKKGLVRIYGHNKLQPKVGHILASKGEQGDNRFAPAFKGVDVTNFYAENVIVHHAGGMAFLFENCDNVDLFKCQVTPSNGRMVSSTADATHFVGCRGKVSLRDCVFHNQLDDAMNVHGTYQEIMDVLGDNVLGLRMGHFQQLGFTLAKPGDKVGIVRLEDSFHAYETLTVKSVDFINGRYQRITFEENLPAKVAAGDLLENLSAYPEVLVENCDISRNRARGILISNPVSTTIRNCYFATEMEALLLPVESSSWFESGNATNVLIENNTFQDCNLSGFDRGIIRFCTDDESDNYAFSNIQILNNKFNHFDNWILEVSNVDGLLFKGNTITNSGTFPMRYGKNPVVTVQYSKDIVFEDNTYNGKATEMVKSLKGMKEVKFN